MFVRFSVMYNCFNFNHNATVVFSFKISRWYYSKDKDEFVKMPSNPSVVSPPLFKLLLNPNNASSKFIWVSNAHIFTCHNENLVLRSKNGMSYFMVAIKKKKLPANQTTTLIPLVRNWTRIMYSLLPLVRNRRTR